jgi:DNA-binding LacI/PurR family transcriptional regulator
VPRSSAQPPVRVIRSTTDFAQHVGLARTTVSRVLNGQPGLKQKTIDRVHRAIAETGFTPNAYALHLKGKRTATVGICVETLMTPPAVLKLATLQRLLREADYTSLIEVLAPDGSHRVVRHFLSMRVEAVVFIGHFAEAEIAQRIEELKRHGIAHLVIDHAGIPGANTVALDRRRAMVETIAHLVGLGHRSFGLLGLSSPLRSAQDRRAGVADGLAAAGLTLAHATLSLDHLHPRHQDFAFGRALAGSFLAQARPPTALVALNDEIAIGAINGLQHAGHRVPEHFSVSGFNNQDLGRMIVPTLTSVDQQIERTVEAAASILLAQIGRPPRGRPIVRSVQPLLVVRESTGPARA